MSTRFPVYITIAVYRRHVPWEMTCPALYDPYSEASISPVVRQKLRTLSSMALSTFYPQRFVHRSASLNIEVQTFTEHLASDEDGTASPLSRRFQPVLPINSGQNVLSPSTQFCLFSLVSQSSSPVPAHPAYRRSSPHGNSISPSSPQLPITTPGVLMRTVRRY